MISDNSVAFHEALSTFMVCVLYFSDFFKNKKSPFYFLVSYIYHPIDANAWLVNLALKVSS